jgi:hypothetical protein
MQTHLFRNVMPLLLFALFEATGDRLKAQTESTARDYAEILKPIPPKDFLKLRGNGKEAAAMEMSKTLATNEVTKTGTYKVKVTKVEAHPFPDQGVTGWKITSDSEHKVKIGSMNIPVYLFVYVAEDAAGVMPKLKRGDTVLATGTMSSCAMNVIPQGGPMMNLTLWLANVKNAPK